MAQTCLVHGFQYSYANAKTLSRYHAERAHTRATSFSVTPSAYLS